VDKHNYFYEQLVVDSDLDDIYADAESMERDGIATPHGLCQAPAAGSPGPTRFGGILSGLVVTRTGAKSLQVSAGQARDSAGRLITVPLSTIDITNLGDTTVGDSTNALGGGAAVAIGGGLEAWLSVYAMYGELGTDARTDGLGVPVNFRVSESFCFHLALGTPAAAPAVLRAALADGYVLLADVLLDESEEIVRIDPGGGLQPVICGTDAEFDYFPAYAALTGRRSDWLTCEDSSNHPLLATAGAPIRAATPREAIDLALRRLQSTTTPAGSQLLGGRAMGGTEAYEFYTAKSLPSGTIDAQLYFLLQELNKKLSNGGNLQQPFYDDFFYVAELVDPLDWPSWGLITENNTAAQPNQLEQEPYGVVSLLTDSNTDDTAGLIQGGDSQLTVDELGNDCFYAWPLGSTQVQATFRFRINSALADAVVQLGFGRCDINVKAICAVAEIDGAAGGTVRARVLNSAGAGGALGASVGSIVSGAWHTVRVTVTSDTQAEISLDGGAAQAAALGAGAFHAAGALFARVKTLANATASLSLDCVCAGVLGSR